MLFSGPAGDKSKTSREQSTAPGTIISYRGTTRLRTADRARLKDSNKSLPG